MLLWFTFALIAAAVTALLMRSPPLRAVLTENAPDRAVYRDQIAELDADVARGLIAPEEAAAARTEIARRLLKSADSAQPLSSAVKSTAASAQPLVLAALAIPVLSLMLYLKIGSPELPGRPLAERLAERPETATAADMIAKVEARLRDKPEDGQGWSVIAPVYLAQGRAVEAAQAFARALNFAGESPERLAGLAKANVMAGNGIVNEQAHKAYARLAEIDPSRVEAKYWLAVYEEQNGRTEAAAEGYRKLLAEAPADAPWRAAVAGRLADVTGGKKDAAAAGTPAAGVSAPVLASPTAGGKGGNPTPKEFVAAAQKLAPEMRTMMIGGRMIPKAQDAVKQNPKDWAAWSRIVTGFTALGKSDEAQSALKEARNAAAGDATGAAELDSLAKDLGLNS